MMTLKSLLIALLLLSCTSCSDYRYQFCSYSRWEGGESVMVYPKLRNYSRQVKPENETVMTFGICITPKE